MMNATRSMVFAALVTLGSFAGGFTAINQAGSNDEVRPWVGSWTFDDSTQQGYYEAILTFFADGNVLVLDNTQLNCQGQWALMNDGAGMQFNAVGPVMGSGIPFADGNRLIPSYCSGTFPIWPGGNMISLENGSMLRQVSPLDPLN